MTQRWLWKCWEWAKLRLGFIEHTTPYCIQCSACGYDGCCPPQQCVGGFFCGGHYGPARVGPVNELVQLRKHADDWGTRLTPKHVPMQADDLRVDDYDVFGNRIQEGNRLETHAEVRARVYAEFAREKSDG